VSKVYVPNEYTVYLAPGDREQFTGYETSLLDELREHLSEHARRERYALLSQPRVLLESDADLAVGEFGIATRMVQPKGRSRDGDAPAPTAEAGHTMVYKQPVADPTERASVEELGIAPAASVTLNGARHEVGQRRMVIGRSKECDLQVDDPNVSRRHAELRREGTSFWIVDLGSTNGIDVNGRRTARAKLEDGDTVTLGTTDLVFHRN
jgi:hypothetical protein